MLDFHRRRRRSGIRPAVRPELKRLLPLAFMAAAAVVILKQLGGEQQPGPAAAEQRVAANASATPAGGPEGKQHRIPAQKHLFDGVPARLWDEVRDDTPLRAAENEAFFTLLRALRVTPLDRLAAQSTGPVAYTQLLQQPQAYRGELVTLAGHVRRAFRLPAARNNLGIQHLYQTWLEPADRSEPVVIYLAELPRGFPEGMELREQVRVHAVFFKRWPYRAASGMRSAPLLLGKTLQWQPAAKSVPQAQDDLPQVKLPLLFALTALGGVVLCLLAVWSCKGSGRVMRFRLAPHEAQGAQSDAAANEPRAFLQQLEQSEPASHGERQ